jgi:hypothetical protein
MKNSNDTIGNRTRDLPACSTVPQPTMPLCTPTNNVGNYNNSQYTINHCLNTIFIHPVTEEEMESLTKGLKGKHSARYDDVHKCLIKQCIQFVKNH